MKYTLEERTFPSGTVIPTAKESYKEGFKKGFFGQMNGTIIRVVHGHTAVIPAINVIKFGQPLPSRLAMPGIRDGPPAKSLSNWFESRA